MYDGKIFSCSVEIDFALIATVNDILRLLGFAPKRGILNRQSKHSKTMVIRLTVSALHSALHAGKIWGIVPKNVITNRPVYLRTTLFKDTECDLECVSMLRLEITRDTKSRMRTH